MLTSTESAGNRRGIDLKEEAYVVECFIVGVSRNGLDLVGEAGNEVFNGGHRCQHGESWGGVAGCGIVVVFAVS